MMNLQTSNLEPGQPGLSTSGGGMLTRPVRRRPVISLTPLIDVVFILLIFFMLASSFLDWRTVKLSAPAVSAASSSMEGSLLVEIRTDGLRFGGETVSLDQLVERIQKGLSDSDRRVVLIRPDQGISLQQTVTVVDRLTAVGITNMSLIRDKSK